ncbi:MAG: SulP family inorganic anion transporter [Planctomycetota bacterium]|nr:SulP family inorganic anion transporter [Planctomycetota bacterium]
MRDTVTQRKQTLALTKSTSWAGVLARDAAAGTLTAAVTLGATLSYGVLIFSGPILSGQLAVGLHAVLLTSWLMCLIVALGSSSPVSIAGPTPKPTAVLAVMAATLARELVTANVPPEQLTATILVMLAISAILTGLLLYLLGLWRCGRLLSFVPYSVVAGFMASTGFLLISGGLGVLLGEAPNWGMLKTPPRVPIPALLATAAVLFVTPAFKRLALPVLSMPVGLLAGSVAFFSTLGAFGMSMDSARQAGLLFRVPALDRIPIHFPTLDHVRTDLLMHQWENLLALVVVVVFSIMFTSIGMDAATEDDVDFDKEMQINGVANVFAGLAGGMVGCVSTTRSLLHHKAGAVTRKGGVWCAILVLASAYLMGPWVEYIPKPVLVGMLLYLGCSMLKNWLWKSYRQLSLFEFALIAAILLLVAFQGLVVGVVFGLVIALVYFVYSYSRASCVRYTFAVSDRTSNKERSMEAAQALRKHGACARALVLQGYIFFATSSRILELGRELLGPKKTKYILLDFRMVQGIDISAVVSLVKLRGLCQREGAELALCGLSAELERMFNRGGLLPSPHVPVFPDLDRGLEHFEEKILESPEVANAVQPQSTRAEVDAASTMTFMSMDDVLRRLLEPHFSPDVLDSILSRCEPVALEQDEKLFGQGDPGDAMYFIERGEVSVQLTVEGRVLRLRTFGPGSVVGEMALYSHLPRTAEGVAVTNARVQKFRYAALEELEKSHPDAAMEFHRYIIKLLSQRIIVANDQIRALF